MSRALLSRILCGLAVALVLALAIAGPARAEESPAAPAVDWPAAVDALLAKGDAAVAAYRPDSKMAAAEAFSAMYFEQFEPLEGPIGTVDPALKDRIEAGFGQLIGQIRQARPQPEIAAAWTALRAQLAGLPQRFAAATESGFWATFLQSFLILLREGFEAMLVITALVAYLRRAGAADKVRVVYHGVGWALAASLATAWAFGQLLARSGAGREVLEGATLMVAALVLFYCSYWLFARREAARWQRYVKEQIEQALSGGRLFALGAAAFLAVYREGAETVLFYQALSAGAPGQAAALWGGLGAAVVALAVLYIAMQRLSLKLPLGLFFSATAGLLYLLAVSFAGKGVVELQNGHALSITPLPGWPSFDWLGVFPTVEGLAAQAVLVVPVLAAGLWMVTLRRRKAACVVVEESRR